MARLLPSRLPVRASVLISVGVAALTATIALPPTPRLVWNVSASAPIGLYAVGGRHDIAAGDMVLARVPDRWRRLAAERRYIPINVPLVKRVAAVPGDRVCARGRDISVNGRPVTDRREADGRGRPMPRWSGCVTLRTGALFLLMDSPDSFDGRYFGPTSRGDVIGEARLLWLG
ncbi:S26 family signal peptidase [Sphingomonas sp. ID1715]|jgi:conjugative transfer signal peptidase TraF|uniref:S26 family signal peptidase n=1 Tax=Sphingomonadales TaxID=204457 RepID=UPI0007301649|nr:MULTISPECIES: S26 family signal peptidase [Sphingomonadales]MBA3942385.1 S26 family signal peptidase [Sphingopyxis sp.]MBA4081088.1 S26 family signal peptidase [Erythrobacter sp.]MBU0774510.1 S26 family signal peptidase [Alphaproteobacteria bacterium]KTE26421.1 S26 family signal peptidase [Sphingopyxis sp. H057]KTE52825.1 S26 family signal peptidase [Sphingopyxis sp. H073]